MHLWAVFWVTVQIGLILKKRNIHQKGMAVVVMAQGEMAVEQIVYEEVPVRRKGKGFHPVRGIDNFYERLQVIKNKNLIFTLILVGLFYVVFLCDKSFDTESKPQQANNPAIWYYFLGFFLLILMYTFDRDIGLGLAGLTLLMALTKRYKYLGLDMLGNIK